MDRNKESLFNILVNNFHIEEMEVLDLFSGTGNVAFEFASREAEKIIAVDAFPGCVKFIRKQAEAWDFDNLEVVMADVLKFLQNDYNTYDFIYADPPFAFDKFPQIPQLVFERKLLKPGGWFVMEHPSQKDFSHLPYHYENRAFGQCIMSFFRFEEEEEGDEG